jgi:hypothetical protein
MMMSPAERLAADTRHLLLKSRKWLTHRKGCIIEWPWLCSCGLCQLLSEIEYVQTVTREPGHEERAKAS